MERGSAILLLAAVCGSCVPVPAAHRAMPVPARVAADDRALLRRLALADPIVVTGPIIFDATRAAGAPAFSLAGASQDDASRAADCLTAAVYYEARSEPLDGQRAVAQVVLNRVRDPAFPASVCRVVYQRSAHVCQFTFACDGSMDRPIQPRAWAIARAVALAALDGAVFAPVGAATHYHANYVLPWWASSLTRIGAIGNHIFYRWQDRLSGALAFRQNYAGHEGDGWTVASAAGMTEGDGFASGVTVHRGGDNAPQPGATRAGAAVPSSTTGFGVYIHRGDGNDDEVVAGGAAATD